MLWSANEVWLLLASALVWKTNALGSGGLGPERGGQNMSDHAPYIHVCFSLWYDYIYIYIFIDIFD